MKILVIGNGGREHALLWKLAQSPRRPTLYCAPGNAGTAALATNVPIAADRVEALRDFARAEGVDVTIVGPELPLVLGIADVFGAVGLRVFGPTAAGARLEGSKAFTKELLVRYDVPTARARTFDDPAAARRGLAEIGAPLVVKADGLAAGKGVFICDTLADAERAIEQLMERRAFGSAGARVVVEEFLAGEEVSFMALTDGRTAVALASSQDHKRAYDGDIGPNTGGMGAYSPAPLLTPALEATVMDEIIEPVLEGLRAERITYRGLLYAGLMIEDGQPRVLEFNVRFGDPEAQVLLLRLRTDLVDLVEAVLDGFLVGCRPEWDARPGAGVVLAAGGYPGDPRKGAAIEGLDPFDGLTDAAVFHAGTARRDDGTVVTSGGRVLTVCALGTDLPAAVRRAYEGVACIHFDGMHYRRDIGHRALGRA